MEPLCPRAARPSATDGAEE